MSDFNTEEQEWIEANASDPATEAEFLRERLRIAIERAEAAEDKLAKAAEALVQLVVEYDEVDLFYDEPKSMTSAVNVARLITAELKGKK